MKSKILVVDDEVNVLKLLTIILTNSGYEVESVTGVDEAILLIDSDSPDVVISDLKMPSRDGTEILEYLDKNKLNIPCIMISGHGFIEALTPHEQTLCFKFMRKPFDNDELIKNIEEAINAKK